MRFHWLTYAEGSGSMESRLWDPSESGECGDRKDMRFRINEMDM